MTENSQQELLMSAAKDIVTKSLSSRARALASSAIHFSQRVQGKIGYDDDALLSAEETRLEVSELLESLFHAGGGVKGEFDYIETSQLRYASQIAAIMKGANGFGIEPRFINELLLRDRGVGLAVELLSDHKDDNSMRINAEQLQMDLARIAVSDSKWYSEIQAERGFTYSLMDTDLGPSGIVALLIGSDGEVLKELPQQTAAPAQAASAKAAPRKRTATLGAAT